MEETFSTSTSRRIFKQVFSAEWELEGFQIPQERIAEYFKGGRGIASRSRRSPPRTHPILAVKNAEEAELSLKVKVLSH